jgi:hypothetical protein
MGSIGTVASGRRGGFLRAGRQNGDMSDIDLDLQAVEDQMETDDGESRRIVLGVLDGSTPDEEWIDEVESGAVLVLSVEGDVNELAAGFAREITEAGGELMRFRDFLIVAPPGVVIDTDRL